MTTLVASIRSGVLDAELAALLWLLAEGGVPVHVAAPDAGHATALAEAFAPLARDRAVVTVGGGAALEDVLRQPVPLRPATGAVVILDAQGRVAAAHLQRPPLRDAAGHVRPQGPGVLATGDEARGGWEHFAWGVTPELAEAVGQRAGDFEIEQGRRREFLEAIAASSVEDGEALAGALAAWSGGGGAH
jgi:hypothetical protein